MTTPFLTAYVQLLIHTCHKRGIYAMGGMAAQIPIKHDPAANEQAFARVKADKLREVHAGHDGTWVAHPGLIELAMSVFDLHMKGDNQLDVLPDISKIDTAALLQAPKGQITAKGVKGNMVVALHYLRSWLAGQGCVPVFHLMEDAATAEICRAQLWQYRHWQVRLSDDQVCDDALLYQWLDEAQQQIANELSGVDERQHLHDAVLLLEQMIFNDEFVDFLTLLAYPILNESGADDHD